MVESTTNPIGVYSPRPACTGLAVLFRSNHFPLLYPLNLTCLTFRCVSCLLSVSWPADQINLSILRLFNKGSACESFVCSSSSGWSVGGCLDSPLVSEILKLNLKHKASPSKTTTKNVHSFINSINHDGCLGNVDHHDRTKLTTVATRPCPSRCCNWTQI